MIKDFHRINFLSCSVLLYLYFKPSLDKYFDYVSLYYDDDIYWFFFSFNRLDLPPYETYKKMFEKLSLAVNHTIGFHSE